MEKHDADSHEKNEEKALTCSLCHHEMEQVARGYKALCERCAGEMGRWGCD